MTRPRRISLPFTSYHSPAVPHKPLGGSESEQRSALRIVVRLRPPNVLQRRPNTCRASLHSALAAANSPVHHDEALEYRDDGRLRAVAVVRWISR